MQKKYIVRLTDNERCHLKKLISSGSAPALKTRRARILLKADQASDRPYQTDAEIARAVEVCRQTVERTRQRFVEEGFEACLERPQREDAGVPKLMNGDAEAHLVALACSPAPKGRARWTLRLLADKMVELNYVPTISYETIRVALKKMN